MNMHEPASRRCIRRRLNVLWSPAWVRTSLFGTRSLHMIPRMCRKLRMWNVLGLFSFFFFPCLEGPRLIATQEGGENTGTVYCHVGVGVEFSQLCNKHTWTHARTRTHTHTHTFSRFKSSPGGCFQVRDNLGYYTGQNPLCLEKFVGYSELRYNAAYSDAVFRPQLIHHFGYNKVIAYSEANSCNVFVCWTSCAADFLCCLHF